MVHYTKMKCFNLISFPFFWIAPVQLKETRLSISFLGREVQGGEEVPKSRAWPIISVLPTSPASPSRSWAKTAHSWQQTLRSASHELYPVLIAGVPNVGTWCKTLPGRGGHPPPTVMGAAQRRDACANAGLLPLNILFPFPRDRHL